MERNANASLGRVEMMKFVVITFLGIVGLLTFVACAADD